MHRPAVFILWVQDHNMVMALWPERNCSGQAMPDHKCNYLKAEKSMRASERPLRDSSFASGDQQVPREAVKRRWANPINAAQYERNRSFRELVFAAA
jgi:hypothetical protein